MKPLRYPCALMVALACGAAAQAAKPQLNDTGMGLCVGADGKFTSACQGTGQDGEYGRDVNHTPGPGDRGRLGFAYEKVCNSGEREFTGSCVPQAVLGSGPNDWGCTRDKVSGLVWEIKTQDGGPRDMHLGYTQLGNNKKTDANALVNLANEQAWCGAKNWRIPTRQELQGLVDYGLGYPGPLLDLSWFPNTPSDRWYWTSTANVAAPNSAWAVAFSVGMVQPAYRNNATLALRLVSGQ